MSPLAIVPATIGSLLDGGVSRVVVVVASGGDLALVRLLADQRVQLVVNEEPARGMFSSIQTGLGVAGHILGNAAPPIGHYQFCRDEPAACSDPNGEGAPRALT